MSVESINSSAVAAVQQQPATQGSERLTKTEPSSSLNKTETDVAESSTQEVTREEVDNAVSKLNDFMQNTPQRNLSFSVDEDTKDLVVKVTDSTTMEVIKQMPTEEALAVAKQIESMLGLILNDKA